MHPSPEADDVVTRSLEWPQDLIFEGGSGITAPVSSSAPACTSDGASPTRWRPWFRKPLPGKSLRRGLLGPALGRVLLGFSQFAVAPASSRQAYRRHRPLGSRSTHLPVSTNPGGLCPATSGSSDQGLSRTRATGQHWERTVRFVDRLSAAAQSGRWCCLGASGRSTSVHRPRSGAEVRAPRPAGRKGIRHRPSRAGGCLQTRR